jgi:hypothetical protein
VNVKTATPAPLALLAVGSLMLQGCGGFVPCYSDECLFDPPTSAASVSTGSVSGVSALNYDGTVIPKKVARDGAEYDLTKETYLYGYVYYTDGSANYLVRTADDGESFVLTGYDAGGNPLGSYFSTASVPQVSGNAFYTGGYRGQLIADGGPINDVQGYATVAVNFDTSEVSSTISSRTPVWPGIPVDDIQIRETMTFTGAVTGGFVTASHLDANSSGSLNGLLYDKGIVGSVSATHVDALGPGLTITEVGVLTAD